MSWSNSLSSLKTLLRCHPILIVVFVTFQMSRGWSTPTCDIKALITLEGPNFKMSGPQNSPAKDVFKGVFREGPNAQLEFAVAAESVLLDAVKDSFCSNLSEPSSISIEMKFVSLGIEVAQKGISYFKAKLSPLKGAYAQVSINRAKRTVVATIYWNSRRMLRDQLHLEGLSFNDNKPVFPYPRKLFEKHLKTYESWILQAPSKDVARIRRAQFKNTV